MGLLTDRINNKVEKTNLINKHELNREPVPFHCPADWLAQLGERRSAEREVTGSNPGRTNTQGEYSKLINGLRAAARGAFVC